jgi:DNA-binding NtrC family response regulator
MAQILVIDDDSALRDLIGIVLTRSGHVVSSAANGQEGLEICRGELPDVVVTDIVMPELDGLGFINAARSEFPEIRIVAMSGGLAASPGYLAAARSAGVISTLSKPFALGQLHDAIDTALRSRQPNEQIANDALRSLPECALA